MVLRRIAAVAAVAMLGGLPAAAAGAERRVFDATLAATLEREWSWRGAPGCEQGEGRRVVRIRSARPVRLGAAGGTVRVEGTLELSGRATCDDDDEACERARTAIRGSLRVTLSADAVRLSDLRYRPLGTLGCAPDVAAVRAALPGEPRLSSVVVHDRDHKLRNARIRRVTVRGSWSPSTRIEGDVSGRVDASVRWSLSLSRR